MNIKLIRYTSIVLFLVAFVASNVFAKEGSDQKKASSLSKTLGTPVYTKMNINNISTWFKNDGESDISQSGNSGFTYPKGSNRQCVFQSGFLWGGKVDDQVRIGGSVYRQGTVGGRIKPDGTPADPDDDDVRIYRVRSDYINGDLSAELADGDGSSIDEIRAQYEKDWNEWPASQGAPFEDNNGNGIYEPTIDVPGVPDADQTIWFVANDFDPAQTDFMYGSLPMGIEEQVTVWGYKRIGALGNMIFRKYLIINKNSDQKAFTDMYVSMWSDADVGDSGDDFNGCDVDLSLAYTYNANSKDATYGNIPPASGFDFFQGPIVDGEATDVAIFKGKYVEGKKNLPMTAHYFFIRGDATWGDPPQGVYQGSLEWYNLFQGKVGRTGTEFPDPTTGGTTKFALWGDPVTRTGWIDGMLHPAGDRRNGMASGPFNMAYGDTQEIALAEVAAGAETGVDNRGAVAYLKFFDKQAQVVYDNFFNVPEPPPAPKVTTAAFDQTVVLSWGEDTEAIAATENHVSGNYKFQGYNVYQLPSKTSLFSEGRRVATYDLVDNVLKIEDEEFDATSGVVLKKVKQFGTDSGIKRYIAIETDAFKGGLTLLNGSDYYFAVTAYSYNDDPTAVPRQLENALTIHTLRPQKPNPGVRYEGDPDDAISATHSLGASDGSAFAYVVDPSKTTGHNYKVTFKVDEETGEYLWDLVDVTASRVVLENQEQTDAFTTQIVDGLQLRVFGPPIGVNEWSFTPSADRWFTGVDWGGGSFFGGLDVGSHFFGSNVTADQYVTVELRFLSTPTGQRAYRYLRGGTPNYAYQNYEQQHFTVWDITSDPPRQLAVAYVEQNGKEAANSLWQPTASNADREYLFIFNSPYTENPDSYFTDPSRSILNNADQFPTLYALWPLLRGTRQFNPQDNQVFKITPNFANSGADVFTFTAPTVVDDPELAKKDVDDINVFPNPYYGVNPQELNKYQRFVTFSHLPRKATLRIFNLAGQLVRTIDKEAPEQFQRWDLQNEDELPVASGLYIVHIDMPDLGKTKIVKVAVIQEQQILDRF